ncbi:UNVERIFIED_CONTAM: hypothetical protein DES50_11148 [Williamsia faeni]
MYALAVLAVTINALVVGGEDGSPDPFGAAEALRYITWLSIGYMIARGLAKSGSPERYDHSKRRQGRPAGIAVSAPPPPLPAGHCFSCPDSS